MFVSLNPRSETKHLSFVNIDILSSCGAEDPERSCDIDTEKRLQTKNIHHILNFSARGAMLKYLTQRGVQVTFVSSQLCTANMKLLSLVAGGRTLKTILSSEGRSLVSQKLPVDTPLPGLLCSDVLGSFWVRSLQEIPEVKPKR